MLSETECIKFDPGFAPYVLAFNLTKDLIYQEINKFNNMSQKKVKFMQYHTKILDLFYNNIGFYTGCLMWAGYIKSLPEQDISGNHCFGEEYKEYENTFETRAMFDFTLQYPKDMKYFMGKSFTFDENIIKLIKTYEEFLILNKGFTETKKNTDVIMRNDVKIQNVNEYNQLIETAIEQGNLALLSKHINKILN